MTKDNGMDVTPSWDELRKSVDILRSMGDALQKERDALDMTRQRLLDERNQALKERDALRREAELHAQEARTQRATVQEIYQLVTGSTGEPGDWHGAEPVRALIEERDALAEQLAEERRGDADIRGILDRVKLERDALAAHVEAVADALGLPPHNDNRRRTSVVVTSIENACRFADYLHAIEREFLMVPGEPDDDFPDEEPEPECLVTSWGARSREHYVEQFRSALACLKARWQAEALEVLADELSLNAGNARENGYWMTADAMEDASSEALEASGRIRRQAEEGCS